MLGRCLQMYQYRHRIGGRRVARVDPEATIEDSRLHHQELCAAVERGEDDAKLKVRKEIGARGAEAVPAIMEKINSAPVGA